MVNAFLMCVYCTVHSIDVCVLYIVYSSVSICVLHVCVLSLINVHCSDDAMSHHVLICTGHSSHNNWHVRRTPHKGLCHIQVFI
jgi:hypothetical protein